MEKIDTVTKVMSPRLRGSLLRHTVFATLILGHLSSTNLVLAGSIHTCGDSLKTSEIKTPREKLILALSRPWTKSVVSPDEKYLLTLAENDGVAGLWDIESGTLVHSFDNHWDRINSAIFSPDGKYILTASNDRTAKLWDVKSGAVIHSFKKHFDTVYSAVFSPNGKYILTASRDKTAKLWNIESGELIHSFEKHTDRVMSAVFSPDSKYIVTASYDRTAKLWSVESGNLIYSLEGHIDKTISAIFSPSGKYILTTSFDRTAKLWNVKSGALVHSFEAHWDFVWFGVFSPDETYVLTTSVDPIPRLWNVQTGALVHSFDDTRSLVKSTVYPYNLVKSAAFSRDGKYLLMVSFGQTAALWDTARRQWKQSFENVISAKFSSDGKSVVVDFTDGQRKSSTLD